MSAHDLTSAIAILMLQAVEAGATDRDAIALNVRERLDPLDITDDHLSAAAERIIELFERDRAA